MRQVQGGGFLGANVARLPGVRVADRESSLGVEGVVAHISAWYSSSSGLPLEAGLLP